MRISHILVVALFGLPLGGCSQPLPDWAMNPQAQYHARLTEPTPGVPRNPRRIRAGMDRTLCRRPTTLW
jgi:hypothetical protein